MTGSVAIDVVIGLVFIYLLYSLLATVVCEIIANYLGLRARNLQNAIQRMLEDNPEVSEVKLKAFFKQIGRDVAQLFHNPEGPAACVFYRLPIIKYLARNTLFSKPAYITRQNFSKAIFEIFRRYGGAEDQPDLEKIQKVLRGALEYPGILKEIKEEINKGAVKAPLKPDQPRDFNKIFDAVKEKATAPDVEKPLDLAQQKLFVQILKLLNSKNADENKKSIVFKIDELLNLFGHETRSHLLSLLKDSNSDLLKFRFHLEQWFDDTMDRATGWYKQRIQFLLLLIGLAFALCFNANTLDIVRKLSVDKEARDKMVQLAVEYVNDPANNIPDASGNATITTYDSIKIDSLRKVKLDSLKKLQAKLQKQIDEANSLLGMGWPDLPDSLSVLPWTQQNEDSVRKIRQQQLLGYSVITIDKPESEIAAKDKSSMDDTKKIVIYPYDITKGILGCLYETNTWVWQSDVYGNYNNSRSKIKVDNSGTGFFLYILTNLFSYAFWGYLLTAIAISLGAPFWFDLLNKLVRIRGSVKEPTRTQAGDAAAPALTSDPAHLIHRKG